MARVFGRLWTEYWDRGLHWRRESMQGYGLWASRCDRGYASLWSVVVGVSIGVGRLLHVMACGDRAIRDGECV